MTERSFRVVAEFLDVTPRQAEVLVAIASGCATRVALCHTLDMTDQCLRVHVNHIRNQGWNIQTHNRKSYFLTPEHRTIVLEARGRPEALRGSSQDFGGVANGPAAFLASTRRH